MAFREVPIPSHISILMVEQEVLGDDTVALDSVLKADVWRDRLTAEEKELNALLASLEATTAEGSEDTAEVRSARRKKEDAVSRLGEVQQLLVEMEAESAPARAAALLAGLGFSHDDQKRATKTFSGGWRMRLSLARALFCKPDLLVGLESQDQDLTYAWAFAFSVVSLIDDLAFPLLFRCWTSRRTTWVSTVFRPLDPQC